MVAEAAGLVRGGSSRDRRRGRDLGGPHADATCASRACRAEACDPAGPRRSERIARRFSLDYSVADQQLVLKFAADGYFSVHFSPGLDTIVDSRVTAGSTRREPIPNNATEAEIVFSAAPQSTSGGVSLTKDEKSGT